jgi:DNA-binding Xre family transcriptional regulator
MAKTLDASKLLSGCMDGAVARIANLRMAQRAKKGQRLKGQFHRTFIRQWREHRGLTLERLADRVGMTAGNLSQLERGNQGYVQNTLEAIAHALQTDTASLLMRDPSDSESLWTIWGQAKPGERQMLMDIAKTVVKTGTND